MSDPRPGIWRRRVRVGGHWWAERPDGSWHWWSWHKADWEPRDGAPEGVRPLPPESDPVLRAPPHPEAAADREVQAALTGWLVLFLFWGIVGGLVVFVATLALGFFLSVGFWGVDEPNPFRAIVVAEALWAGLCAMCAAVNVALIRRSARARAERAARGEPEPRSVFERKIGVVSGIAGGAAMLAGLVGAALLLSFLLFHLLRALSN